MTKPDQGELRGRLEREIAEWDGKVLGTDAQPRIPSTPAARDASRARINTPEKKNRSRMKERITANRHSSR
ncbi:hypothetical protein LTR28_008254 [Elasticomyces elasticus]|nr:hypothetical protein LTR28_008254 [Elasticomyces elasticus]